jgi:hypothetical protein
MTIGAKTITITRDVDDVITSWTDGTNTWTLTRVAGVVTAWTVT